MAPHVRPSFIKHTPVGKSTQTEKYTASAHIRYITRRSATDYVYAERMPSHYWAAQRFMDTREDSIRKNGRVCDKLIIVYPTGMQLEHAVEATRRFGFLITQGRAPFFFSLQNFTEDTPNPHSHFILIDADVKDGKRVFRSSDKDSTDRIKDLWEKAANEVLEREGYDFRLDRAAHALAKEPEHPIAPPDAPATSLDDAPAPVHELEPQIAQEADVAKLTHEEHLEAIQNGVSGSVTLPGPDGRADRIARAAAIAEELRRLEVARIAVNTARDDFSTARAAADYWKKEADKAASQARMAYKSAADEQERLADYVTGTGKLRGVHVKLWRWEWKSGTRRDAEMQERIADNAKRTYERADREADGLSGLSDQTAQEAHQLAEKMHTKVEETEKLYGTREDMRDAEAAFRNGMEQELEGITAAQVYEEFEAGNISFHEAISACRQLGDSEYVALLIDLRDRDADLGYER